MEDTTKDRVIELLHIWLDAKKFPDAVLAILEIEELLGRVKDQIKHANTVAEWKAHKQTVYTVAEVAPPEIVPLKRPITHVESKSNGGASEPGGIVGRKVPPAGKGGFFV